MHFVLWSDTLKKHLNKNRVNPATLNVCCVSLSISIQFNFLRRWRKLLLGNTFHLIPRILLVFNSNDEHVNWISKAISDYFFDKNVQSTPFLNSQPQNRGFSSNLCTCRNGIGICLWWRGALEYFVRTHSSPKVPHTQTKFTTSCKTWLFILHSI